MIKTVAPIVCVFDSEYVPCPETGRKVYGLPEKQPTTEVIQFMYTQAPEHQPPRLRKDGTPDKMMKLLFYKIISISAVVRYNDGSGLRLRSLPHNEVEPEREILQTFLHGVGDQKMQLVGWASRLFDIPVMAQRCLIHGLKLPEFFEKPEKPWLGADYLSRNSDFHVDLMDEMVAASDGKARPKLNEICRACGIPGKLGMAGEDVETAYYCSQNGYKAIREYNDFDALSTYWLWVRMAAMAGLVDYDQEVLTLKTLVRKEISLGRKHLKTYAKAAGW